MIVCRCKYLLSKYKAGLKDGTGQVREERNNPRHMPPQQQITTINLKRTRIKPVHVPACRQAGYGGWGV